MEFWYVVAELRRHWREFSWWRGRFIAHIVGRYFRSIAPSPSTPVVDLDWDNLVILDACRYDLFEEAIANHSLPGTLSKRISMGSGTPDFLKENFSGGRFHDTVYVTANPYVNTELDEGQFHVIDAVWRDGWDDELQTVLPEVMVERTVEAAKRYPNKRLVTHFMQPHFPFIGENRIGERRATVIRQRALGQEETPAEHRVPTPFEQLRRGELGREEVWRAYRSNLERVLPAVETLLETLPGKTVVTADHGNALGEFAWPFPIRIYGHPLGVHIPALVEVPWLAHETGERKTIIEDEPRANTQGTEYGIEDRLHALGYVE